MALLEIRNLKVTFDTPMGRLHAVDGVDLSIDEGEVLCVVGESGSGKSLSVLAIMGLVGVPGRVTADLMRFDGKDLMTLPSGQRRAIVGRDIAMIFQDPKSSLNPCFPVGWQIAESLRIHHALPSSKIRDHSIELMGAVGIVEPEQRYSAYPHQLSGGMNQRIMIAMAVSCRPRLLIADEPTSALDVTVQNQILALLANLQKDFGMALSLITHDMGIVARSPGRVQVMYAGKVVEEGPTADVLATPRHPYTAALLASRPELAGGARRLRTIPGTVPGADDRPAGCLFGPRCTRVGEPCVIVRPGLGGLAERRASCHFPLEEEPETPSGRVVPA